MTADLPSHFPFLTFRTKPNVSKSKLGGDFAKKGWNDFSTGFSGNASFHVEQTSFTKGEESIKKKPKIDPEVFKKQILSEGCKKTERKPLIAHKEAEFFTSKAKDLCSLIQKKSLQSEDPRIHHSNSVFLDVQNIQDSFQHNKRQKFSVKSSSEFKRNFDTDLVVTKKVTGQENVPKKNGISACQFIFQENDFSLSTPKREVQKTNIFSSLVKKNYATSNNLSESITNSYSKNHCKIKSNDGGKFPINTGKACLQNQERITWLQSLLTSDTEVAQEETVGKKRIRNIVPGGLVEQMLKLQRMEKSEEVIWNHNVDRNKKKGKYLTLMLTSISSTADIVIAKCLSLQTESSSGTEEDDKDDFFKQYNGCERIVVLLKRSVFNKMHLKTRSVFHLYPPWQNLHLPLISCPVILSAKFIEVNPGESQLIHNKISLPKLLPLFSSFTSDQAMSNFSEIFYHWEQPMSLSGRIQRIWKIEISNKNTCPLTSIPNYFRYSLLVQNQNGIYYELVLLSSHFWEEFISQAEGKCFEFHNLHVIQWICLKKHPHLFRVLDSLSMLQDGEKGINQEFYCQMTYPSSSGIPESVSDERFPAYCSISVLPLASLFSEINIRRFSCIGKIIFQFRKTLYLCDESVMKYVQLECTFPISLLVGSLVLIRDAQFLEGCLFLDKYSSFIQIPEDSQMDEGLKQLCGNRLNLLMSINLQNIIPSINVAPEDSTFVFITGEVISVDENNSLSWLQCNMCLSEDLVQDSNMVIYCENCFQVVPKPVLNVKMSVICQCSSQLKVEIELLSKTTKRILQISDNSYQPQCNVGDILGKQIGPLFCCIKDSSSICEVKQFRAAEVDTNQDSSS